MENFLGIDIGDNSIKVASFHKEKEMIFLDVIGETRIPSVNWKGDNNDEKVTIEIAEKLKSLLVELKVKEKQVVSCISEDNVISRLVKLPPMSDNEIKDALTYEAETFVPFPLNEVSIDYEIVERDDSGKITLFAIAAKNSVVNNYIKLFKLADLQVLALETPPISIKRLIRSTVSDKVAVMVVDVGDKFSNIMTIDNGNVFFTRAVSVGGEAMTRAVSINLGLDMASAEEYKRAYGMDESKFEGKIKSAIVPVFSSLVEEIRRAMTMFKEERHKNVELIVLVGGGAGMPGLAGELTKITGIEVQVIQPFLRIDCSKAILNIDLNTEGSKYALAVGLGLRDLV